MNTQTSNQPVRYSYKIHKEKALLMAIQGHTYQQIADHFNCTRSAVSQILSKDKALIEGYLAFKENPDKLYELKEYQLLTNLTDEDIKKMPGGSKMLASCQARDKIRLLRGESTENINQINHLIVEAREHRKALEGGAVDCLAGGPGGKGKE